MEKNRMAEVAAMFGKELGQKFFIEGSHLPYIFTDRGLYENGACGDTPMLMRLLTGEAKVKDD